MAPMKQSPLKANHLRVAGGLWRASSISSFCQR